MPKVATKTTFTVIRGTIVKEIRQRFTDWATQVIRLYRGEEFIEMEWVIGPIPIGTDLGKEVVSIFSTNVSSAGVFYTDSNSRQMMKRSCWNESSSQHQKKPVSACYYPVVSRICLQSLNTSIGMCVLTDRAQGGTSYMDGEIELMLHRRLLTDDGFGLEESLNEEAYGVGLVVKGKHRIIFGNIKQELDNLMFFERVSAAARRWHLEPWLFMTAADKINRRKWQNVRNKRYSALRLHGLPRHIHVLTLEPWKGGSVLLRLENTLEISNRGHFRNEKPEGPEDFMNKPSHITVQLQQLFIHLKIKKVRETTLAANQWLDDARQMDWSTRYVYQGADDDILLEDNIEPDDSKIKEQSPDDEKDYKDPSNFSEEEELNRKKQTKKPRKDKKGKKKPSYDEKMEPYRKRRSVNITENVLDNTINASFGDKYNEKYVNSKTETLNNTIDDEQNYLTTATNKQCNKQTTTMLNTDNAVTVNATKYMATMNPLLLRNHNEYKIYQLTKKPTKLVSGPRNTRPIKFFADMNKPAEELTSDEDTSLNLKKRSPKRRKNARIEKGKIKELETRDGPDDGITRSMYEMYYKSRSKPRILKPRLPTSSSSRQTKEEEARGRRRQGKRKLKMRRYKSPVEYSDGGASGEVKVDAPRVEYEEIVATEMEDSEEYYRGRKRKDKKQRADLPSLVTDNTRKQRHHDQVKRGYIDDSTELEDKESLSNLELQRMRARRERSHAHTHAHTDTHDYDALAPVEHEEVEDERDEYLHRRKRTVNIPEETSDMPPETTERPEDPDFVITLRPTQIRTFIVHFETNFRAPSYS